MYIEDENGTPSDAMVLLATLPSTDTHTPEERQNLADDIAGALCAVLDGQDWQAHVRGHVLSFTVLCDPDRLYDHLNDTTDYLMDTGARCSYANPQLLRELTLTVLEYCPEALMSGGVYSASSSYLVTPDEPEYSHEEPETTSAEEFSQMTAEEQADFMQRDVGGGKPYWVGPSESYERALTPAFTVQFSGDFPLALELHDDDTRRTLMNRVEQALLGVAKSRVGGALGEHLCARAWSVQNEAFALTFAVKSGETDGGVYHAFCLAFRQPELIPLMEAALTELVPGGTLRGRPRFSERGECNHPAEPLSWIQDRQQRAARRGNAPDSDDESASENEAAENEADARAALSDDASWAVLIGCLQSEETLRLDVSRNELKWLLSCSSGATVNALGTLPSADMALFETVLQTVRVHPSDLGVRTALDAGAIPLPGHPFAALLAPSDAHPVRRTLDHTSTTLTLRGSALLLGADTEGGMLRSYALGLDLLLGVTAKR